MRIYGKNDLKAVLESRPLLQGDVIIADGGKIAFRVTNQRQSNYFNLRYWEDGLEEGSVMSGNKVDMYHKFTLGLNDQTIGQLIAACGFSRPSKSTISVGGQTREDLHQGLLRLLDIYSTSTAREIPKDLVSEVKDDRTIITYKGFSIELQGSPKWEIV